MSAVSGVADVYVMKKLQKEKMKKMEAAAPAHHEENKDCCNNKSTAVNNGSCFSSIFNFNKLHSKTADYSSAHS